MRKFIFSMRTRALLIYIASLLLTSFALTVLVAILINHWKKSMIQSAVALAEEHGQNVVREITSLIQTGFSQEMKLLRENPRAHASIELLLKQNENIMMAALVDERGTMIIQRFRGRDGLTSGTAIIAPGGNYSAPLSSPADKTKLNITLRNRSEHMRELDIPVMLGEKTMGKLQFSVSEDVVLHRLSGASRLITRSLGVLLTALFLLLSTAYFLLWSIFSRHIELVRERDQLDKLAAIGTLASGLAHEIRNPLNAMNINIDLVREEIEEPRDDSQKKAAEILINLKREIQQLNQTLSNFMKFAIPGKIEKQPVDLVKLIREILEFFSAEFSLKKITVDLRLPETCPLEADPSSLKQLLLNLILNAIQAVEKQVKRALLFELSHDGKVWHLTLTDTGQGFGKVNPEKCFEVFFTTKPTGSGFGLPIARQIAEAHGGRIWAENASGGARLHLTLPK